MQRHTVVLQVVMRHTMLDLLRLLQPPPVQLLVPLASPLGQSGQTSEHQTAPRSNELHQRD